MFLFLMAIVDSLNYGLKLFSKIKRNLQAARTLSTKGGLYYAAYLPDFAFHPLPSPSRAHIYPLTLKYTETIEMPLVDMPLEKLKHYEGRSPKPKDFDKFWDKSLAEMRASTRRSN
jgi:hypothetical protein